MAILLGLESYYVLSVTLRFESGQSKLLLLICVHKATHVPKNKVFEIKGLNRKIYFYASNLYSLPVWMRVVFTRKLLRITSLNHSVARHFREQSLAGDTEAFGRFGLIAAAIFHGFRDNELFCIFKGKP